MFLQPAPILYIHASKNRKRKTPSPPEPPLFEHIYDMPEVGDVKVTLSSTQINGWFILNGQTITGDATAEAAATTLFGSTTLPDYTGKFLRQSANLQEEIGSNSILIQQGNLPVIDLPLTADPFDSIPIESLWAQSYTTNNTLFVHFNTTTPGTTATWRNRNALLSRFKTHLNTGTQIPLEINPESIGVNYMVYLGTSS